MQLHYDTNYFPLSFLVASDSESDSSSLERQRTADGYSKINRKPQTHKRPRKKRGAIPVQPPKFLWEPSTQEREIAWQH